MKKTIVMIFMLLAISLSILMLNNNYNVKKEYEKLNKNKKLVKVNIDKENPFQNISYKNLTKKVKSTAVIFIGTPKNQASRNSINSLSKAAMNTGIDKIYYIDFNKIKDKKIIKKYKIKQATLLVFKNGKLTDNINNSKNKMSKKELIEKYEELINKTLVCNPSGETC